MNERVKTRILAGSMVAFAVAVFLAIPDASANAGRCCDSMQCTAADGCYDHGYCLNGNRCNAGPGMCQWTSC